MSSIWAKVKGNASLHMCWCASGIIGCFVMYGVLQERIMQLPFGTETFKTTLFLVLMNRLCAMGISSAAITMTRQRDQFKPVAPLYTYAVVSVSNVIGTFCQYESLKYLSFPLQTLGKCAKVIPVMLWGMLIMRKRYGFLAFLQAFLITGGCMLFVLTGETRVQKSAESNHYGGLLMLGYLTLDGFTSSFQEKLFKGYNMTTFNQVFYTNLFSALISLLGLISNNQLVSSLSFLSRHPEALPMFTIFSSAAVLGQIFISYTIRTFGSVTFATIMTTRQFLSILLSCIIFLHPLSSGQWCGTLLVFCALYYKVYSGYQDQQASTAHSKSK